MLQRLEHRGHLLADIGRGPAVNQSGNAAHGFFS
jgi:hypothetical protein